MSLAKAALLGVLHADNIHYMLSGCESSFELVRTTARQGFYNIVMLMSSEQLITSTLQVLHPRAAVMLQYTFEQHPEPARACMSASEATASRAASKSPVYHTAPCW